MAGYDGGLSAQRFVERENPGYMSLGSKSPSWAPGRLSHFTAQCGMYLVTNMEFVRQGRIRFRSKNSAPRRLHWCNFAYLKWQVHTWWTIDILQWETSWYKNKSIVLLYCCSEVCSTYWAINDSCCCLFGIYYYFNKSKQANKQTNKDANWWSFIKSKHESWYEFFMGVFLGPWCQCNPWLPLPCASVGIGGKPLVSPGFFVEKWLMFPHVNVYPRAMISMDSM